MLRHVRRLRWEALQFLMEDAVSVVISPPRAIPFGTDHLLVRGPLGVQLVCPVEDLSITPWLAFRGHYGAGFTSFLTRALVPGTTFVDVGANVGVFTLLAAQLVGAYGRVIAYECNPELADLLEKSVAINWFDHRIQLVRKAATDSDEPRRFFAPKHMKALGSVVLPVEGRSLLDDAVDVPVQCERLDDGLANVEFVDLLKIDIEGGEAEAIQGMAGLLDSKRIGMIAMEYRHDAMDDAHKIAMEKVLLEFQDHYGATFHVPGSRKYLDLESIHAVRLFENLLVRFPHCTIPIRALRTF